MRKKTLKKKLERRYRDEFQACSDCFVRTPKPEALGRDAFGLLFVRA